MNTSQLRLNIPSSCLPARIVELQKAELQCGAAAAAPPPGPECGGGEAAGGSLCPAQCKCGEGIVDCRNRGLVAVPATLPPDTTEM